MRLQQASFVAGHTGQSNMVQGPELVQMTASVVGYLVAEVHDMAVGKHVHDCVQTMLADGNWAMTPCLPCKRGFITSALAVEIKHTPRARLLHYIPGRMRWVLLKNHIYDSQHQRGVSHVLQQVHAPEGTVQIYR